MACRSWKLVNYAKGVFFALIQRYYKQDQISFGNTRQQTLPPPTFSKQNGVHMIYVTVRTVARQSHWCPTATVQAVLRHTIYGKFSRFSGLWCAICTHHKHRLSLFLHCPSSSRYGQQARRHLLCANAILLLLPQPLTSAVQAVCLQAQLSRP